MQRPVAPDSPMVRMRGIFKTFQLGTANERNVFHNFSLTIKRGEFISLVGGNGSGKTTLLNLLCGTVAPDAGTIEMAGKRVDSLRDHQRARQIGRVFQDPGKGACGSLTVLENMALADHKGKRYLMQRGINRKRTDAYRAMLSTLGLGLENRTHLKVEGLSGGQRQALSLLLSTMTPIDLLILDEHTAALDPRSSETVMALTEKVVREKGITTLMVTHDLRYAVSYGSRLLMMHMGQMIVDASGEKKGEYPVDVLARMFNEISVGLEGKAPEREGSTRTSCEI